MGTCLAKAAKSESAESTAWCRWLVGEGDEHGGCDSNTGSGSNIHTAVARDAGRGCGAEGKPGEHVLDVRSVRNCGEHNRVPHVSGGSGGPRGKHVVSCAPPQRTQRVCPLAPGEPRVQTRPVWRVRGDHVGGPTGRMATLVPPP